MPSTKVDQKKRKQYDIMNTTTRKIFMKKY